MGTDILPSISSAISNPFCMNKEALHTPCFVLDSNELKANYRAFSEALSRHFPSHILAYSVKTNSNPFLLKVLLEEGAAAEVVSATEYALAGAMGFKRLIYNGPVKEKESFLAALEEGALVNIDSHQELSWLQDLPSGKNYGVGLRVNVSLEEDQTFSRFGFDGEELAGAITYIGRLPHVKLKGLHLHRTSKSRSLEVYRSISRQASELIQRYDLKLDYLDIGGGFFGDFPGKPTYEDYVSTLAENLSPHLTLVVEPGNALAASAFSFQTSVVDVKSINYERVVVCDGSRNDVDPFFRKTNYFKRLLTVEEGRPKVKRQTVVGATCLENDRLFVMEDGPELREGDRVEFCNVGAYTMALSPLFIRYFPRVYIREGEEYRLASEQWQAKDYLNAYGV